MTTGSKEVWCEIRDVLIECGIYKVCESDANDDLNVWLNGDVFMFHVNHSGKNYDYITMVIDSIQSLFTNKISYTFDYGIQDGSQQLKDWMDVIKPDYMDVMTTLNELGDKMFGGGGK
jgi:hypothetical protein